MSYRHVPSFRRGPAGSNGRRRRFRPKNKCKAISVRANPSNSGFYFCAFSFHSCFRAFATGLRQSKRQSYALEFQGFEAIDSSFANSAIARRRHARRSKFSLLTRQLLDRRERFGHPASSRGKRPPCSINAVRADRASPGKAVRKRRATRATDESLCLFANGFYSLRKTGRRF